MAPPAMQAGRQVADNILRALRGEAMVPFRYRDKGIMAVIGRNAGVARIGGLDLKGFVGWAGWLFVHLYYLIGFRNRLAVLARWAWYYLLYDRPIRIIARARVPDGATPIPPDDG
jgi:NADH dehydrogenase